jgi:hypothetical protein
MAYGEGPLLKDPRFGLRGVQLFNVSGLTSTIDLFVQPGVMTQSRNIGRLMDIGFRASAIYVVPGSRWEFGAIAEVTNSHFQAGETGTNLSGFVSPWASYRINSKLTTQHWLIVPFEHQKGEPWTNLSYGATEKPFIQTGLGYDVTDTFWVSLLVNNYLFTAPSLKNTFGSILISKAFM